MSLDRAKTILLRIADEYTVRPDAWTQGVYARDAEGKSVHPTESSAVCYCLAGAAMRYGGTSANIAIVRNLMERAVGYDSLVSWNDAKGRHVGQVIDMLRKAAQTTV